MLRRSALLCNAVATCMISRLRSSAATRVTSRPKSRSELASIFSG